MNLTFHIIKKDLSRMAWALAVWATCGLYLLLSARFNQSFGTVSDKMVIVAIFTCLILSFALIAGIVQEDGLTESDVFWRTRPTSAARMLTAKLGLLVPLFVILPSLALMVSKYWSTGGVTLTIRESVYIFSVWLCVLLCCAALAACSKDLVRYVVLGALCLLVTSFLGAWLSRFGAPVPSKAVRFLVAARMAAVVILCLVLSSAVLANQYLGRRGRLAISYGLIAAAVVGSALINAFWTWDFLPR